MSDEMSFTQLDAKIAPEEHVLFSSQSTVEIPKRYDMFEKREEDKEKRELRPSFRRKKTFQVAVDRIQSLKIKEGEEKEEEIANTLQAFRLLLQEPWWLINPDGKWMGVWDSITFISLCFTGIVTPFEVAILQMKWWDWLFIANRVVDTVFIVDMLMAFFMAYHAPSKQGSQLVKDWPQIVRHYLRGWFFVDLISILPYDFMGGASSLKILRVLRIIRLLKLLRVIRGSRIYQRYEASVSLPSSTISLNKHIFYLIVFGHWMSCVWILTADMQSHYSPTWIDALGTSFYESDGTENGQWRVHCSDECYEKHSYDDAAEVCAASCNPLSAYSIYCGACYWSIVSITSVGYGDITPQNASEMLLTTIYLLCGAFFWAWIIGTMSAIVSTSDPEAIEYQQTMDALNLFMSDKDFPEDLKRRLRMYVSKSKALAKNARHQLLVDKLSPALKAEVLDRSGSWIKNLGMFKGEELSRDFVVGMCMLLSGKVYEPGETVAWDDQLFVVGRGVASRRGKIKTQGTFWGQDFILECIDLKDRYVGHALTFVEILILRRTAFYTLLEEFPKEERMVRHAVVRMATSRGILAAAKKIRDEEDFQRTGKCAAKSWTDLLQEEMINQHHNLTKPSERVKEMAQLQGKQIANIEKTIETISEKLDRLISMDDEKTRLGNTPLVLSRELTL